MNETMSDRDVLLRAAEAAEDARREAERAEARRPPLDERLVDAVVASLPDALAKAIKQFGGEMPTEVGLIAPQELPGYDRRVAEAAVQRLMAMHLSATFDERDRVFVATGSIKESALSEKARRAAWVSDANERWKELAGPTAEVREVVTRGGSVARFETRAICLPANGAPSLRADFLLRRTTQHHDVEGWAEGQPGVAVLEADAALRPCRWTPEELEAAWPGVFSFGYGLMGPDGAVRQAATIDLAFGAQKASYAVEDIRAEAPRDICERAAVALGTTLAEMRKVLASTVDEVSKLMRGAGVSPKAESVAPARPVRESGFEDPVEAIQRATSGEPERPKAAGQALLDSVAPRQGGKRRATGGEARK